MITIERKEPKRNERQFGELAIGQVFTEKDTDSVLIKTSRDRAFDITNNDNCLVVDISDYMVVPVKSATITIEE